MKCTDCGNVFFRCCDDVPYCYDCERKRVSEKMKPILQSAGQTKNGEN